MGAALAYYTVFSLAPLLLIVIAVAGIVFGQDAVRGETVNQLARTLGEGKRERRAGTLEERLLWAKGGSHHHRSWASFSPDRGARRLVFGELQSALYTRATPHPRKRAACGIAP